MIFSTAAVAATAIAALIQTPTATERSDEVRKTFSPFAPAVRTRSDDTNFYVESDGLPDHEMMVGIVAWQQQVPLPQPYNGNNAWSFPLFPKPAEIPVSAKTGFFRGAIAIAANGIPIFNPIKNDGKTDTLLAGELDQFGGHGGRGDDYHYHTAPLHLLSKLGNNTPIAYALDGYPIYGLDCTDKTAPPNLDQFNGHTIPALGYHYHATKTYPYLNGGFHGIVTEKEGQVDPQPRTNGVRPALPPLRGAKVTAFKKVNQSNYILLYEMNSKTYKIDYSWNKNGKYVFSFVDPDGSVRTEIYQARQQGQIGGSQGQVAPNKEDKVSRPWILEHCPELATNKDKSVTLTELSNLIKNTYQEIAGDAESILVDTLSSYRPAKNVIGRYLKSHATEFDENEDSKVTLQEILDEFTSLFHKSDTNHDHTLTVDEYSGK